jgi:hypothetical protein
MTPTLSNGGPLPLIVPFKFPGFAISWAGPGGREEDFCFGSEDGRLQFTTVDGVAIGGFVSGEENPEAVNGVAFIGPVIAVSTRNEVTFWTLPRPGSKEAQRAVFPCGAHGIVATAEGFFVAPLGRTGLMKARAGREEEQPVTVSRATHQTFDYYKVISLHSYGRPEVLACAARFGGVVGTELVQENGRGQISSMTFPGLDVVDVCSLGTGVIPPAVAAVSRNGTLVLLGDVLHDRSPITMRFEDIPGIAYRVFSAQGSLFLLTSTGLYVLAGLTQRFLAGEAVDRTPTPVRAIPLEAVDANLCGERWLLVVMPDGALRFDLSLLIGNHPAGGPVEEPRAAKPTPIDPRWEVREEATNLLAVPS